MSLQEFERLRSEIGPGMDAVAIHSRRRRGPDTVELADWQTLNKICAHPRSDDIQAVRLAMVRGELGQKFVVGHPSRGGEASFGLDLRSDRFGDLCCRSDALQVLRNVEIGFV